MPKTTEQDNTAMSATGQTNARLAAVRELHRVRDRVQADLDKIRVSLMSGGTYPQMRDSVTAARISMETLRGLDMAIESAQNPETGDTGIHDQTNGSKR